MVDKGELDLDTPDSRPIGGAESAFIDLAKQLALRGHSVIVQTRCQNRHRVGNLDWLPFEVPVDRLVDGVIALRDPGLFARYQVKRKKKILWLPNTGRYLLKPEKFYKMLVERPAMVFLGAYHATTYPKWAPSGRRVIIPYGISDPFRTATEQSIPPPPVAVFLSNPLRSLDWLLDVWGGEIHPKMPAAELHVYSGPQTYGRYGELVAAKMAPVLHKAASMSDSGVQLRSPLPRHQLAETFRTSRVLLYRGDYAETFCLAVGETQAMGVPCVLQDYGSVGERIVNGQTGYLAKDDRDFAERALQLLRDDELWLRCHRACLDRYQPDWNEVAGQFEAIIQSHE